MARSAPNRQTTFLTEARQTTSPIFKKTHTYEPALTDARICVSWTLFVVSVWQTRMIYTDIASFWRDMLSYAQHPRVHMRPHASKISRCNASLSPRCSGEGEARWQPWHKILQRSQCKTRAILDMSQRIALLQWQLFLLRGWRRAHEALDT